MTQLNAVLYLLIAIRSKTHVHKTRIDTKNHALRIDSREKKRNEGEEEEDVVVVVSGFLRANGQTWPATRSVL